MSERLQETVDRVQPKRYCSAMVGKDAKRIRKRVNLTLPPDLREAIRERSEATGIPQSQLVAEGLRWRLAQPDVKVPA